MKVDYASDLHFNHRFTFDSNQKNWEKKTRELTRRLLRKRQSDVLVLAGDFSEWNCQTVWILDECSKHYERVYFTYGNHDLYIISKLHLYEYDDSLGRVADLIEKVKHLENVIPLIKTIDEYKGKVIAGDVMWYMPNERGWHELMNRSNDSNYICIEGLSIEEATTKMWKESIDWYRTLENKYIDLFVSHVPPVEISKISGAENYGIKSLYDVEVPFFASKNWICGHNHNRIIFKKDGTTFNMNCIGYPHHINRNRIPTENDVLFDVKTIEI